MTNNEELDVENMSEEELDNYLTSQEGGVETSDESNDVESTEDQTSTTDTETEAENQEADAESETEDQQAEEEEEETEYVLDGDDIPVHYRGKSAKEILEMQLNANKKISQQNSQIYHLNKKLEELGNNQAAMASKPNKSNEDELLEKYEKEDIFAIEKILERKLVERDQLREEAKLQQVEAVKQEHDEIWENLEYINPDLFNEIEGEAKEIMASDIDNTYHKKGWLKNYIYSKRQEIEKKSSGKKTQDKSSLKRKAVTVGSGSKPSSGKKLSKSIDDMNPDEYLAHMSAQGITI